MCSIGVCMSKPHCDALCLRECVAGPVVFVMLHPVSQPGECKQVSQTISDVGLYLVQVSSHSFGCGHACMHPPFHALKCSFGSMCDDNI